MMGQLAERRVSDQSVGPTEFIITPRQARSSTPPREPRVFPTLTLAPVPATPTRPGPPVRYAGKRAFDIAASLTGLALLSPILLMVWAAVKLTSPGPGLFWSERVGLGGRVFRMPKFRSMCQDAPSHAREALPDAANHVTKLGGVLRRWSIDELPQLWSVLRGDMSLIGPRPLLDHDATTRLRQAAYPEIFSVLPGITGLAQVNGRNHVKGHHKVRYDALYARRCTVSLDMLILRRTVGVVLSRHGVL